MKTYIEDVVNIKKLYFYSILGLFVSTIVSLTIIILIFRFFPNFKNVSLLLILFPIIFGIYNNKYSYSKSSKKTEIKLNDKKIMIDSQEILLDNAPIPLMEY